jgi:hypothetical protein
MHTADDGVPFELLGSVSVRKAPVESTNEMWADGQPNGKGGEQSGICTDTTDDDFWASIREPSAGSLMCSSMAADPGPVITATGDL